MQVGDVIEIAAPFTRSDAAYAVESHCRMMIMQELLDFNVVSKRGIITIERLPVDV